MNEEHKVIIEELERVFGTSEPGYIVGKINHVLETAYKTLRFYSPIYVLGMVNVGERGLAICSVGGSVTILCRMVDGNLDFQSGDYLSMEDPVVMVGFLDEAQKILVPMLRCGKLVKAD